MDFCDAIRKTGELGFDCAETYNWKDLDLDKVRATCEETGVELRSMCTTEFRIDRSRVPQGMARGTPGELRGC